MPEAVCAPVDFLSGDYSPQNSVNSARLSARYLARQGKPWDLMAWSFTTKPGPGGNNRKTAIQLQREAAIVVALGGGFQAYIQQNRDGSVALETIPVMAETAKFCRARQAICHHAEAVPQIALLYSTAAHYRHVNGLFSRDSAHMDGILQALLQSQQSVELLSEHHLTGRMGEYPLIVVPEWQYLEPKFKDELVEYVKAGGNLLLVGPKTAQLFQSELGITLEGQSKPEGSVYLAQGDAVATIKGVSQAVALGQNSQPVGRLLAANDPAATSQPAASIATLGKGKIAACYFTCGRSYNSDHSPIVRQFLNDLTRRLFPNPMVEVQGANDVDVSVARNHGKLLVNLVNCSGPHQEDPIIENIAPIGPLQVKIRLAAKPNKVTIEPSGQPVDFEYRDGAVELTVPKVGIHEIVVVETP
jgi:hypothetical protein